MIWARELHGVGPITSELRAANTARFDETWPNFVLSGASIMSYCRCCNVVWTWVDINVSEKTHCLQLKLYYSETLVSVYTGRYNPEDQHRHYYRCENRRSHGVTWRHLALCIQRHDHIFTGARPIPYSSGKEASFPEVKTAVSWTIVSCTRPWGSSSPSQ